MLARSVVTPPLHKHLVHLYIVIDYICLGLPFVSLGLAKQSVISFIWWWV